MSADRCSVCRYDDVLDTVAAYCAQHQAERYEDLAHRTIANELLTMRRGTLRDAIADALRHVATYADYWRCDVDRLRAAIEAEAGKRAA